MQDKQSKDGVTNGYTVQNNQYLTQLQERPWGTFLTEGAPNLSFLFGGDGETRKGCAFPFASQTPGFLSACLGCANRHAWTESSSLSRTITQKIKTCQKTGLYFGGDGETRTLAPVTRPTPLAGAPRHQLEYISVL